MRIARRSLLLLLVFLMVFGLGSVVSAQTGPAAEFSNFSVAVTSEELVFSFDLRVVGEQGKELYVYAQFEDVPTRQWLRNTTSNSPYRNADGILMAWDRITPCCTDTVWVADNGGQFMLNIPLALLPDHSNWRVWFYVQEVQSRNIIAEVMLPDDTPVITDSGTVEYPNEIVLDEGYISMSNFHVYPSDDDSAVMIAYDISVTGLQNDGITVGMWLVEWDTGELLLGADGLDEQYFDPSGFFTDQFRLELPYETSVWSEAEGNWLAFTIPVSQIVGQQRFYPEVQVFRWSDDELIYQIYLYEFWIDPALIN